MAFVFAGAVGLIAYTFVGYPAIMALLARVRPRPLARDSSFLPHVSLVVVAYNEAGVLARKLDNCLALDYPRDRLELIVAADGSDDGTDEIARHVRGVRVLHRPQRKGKVAAMNRA